MTRKTLAPALAVAAVALGGTPANASAAPPDATPDKRTALAIERPTALEARQFARMIFGNVADLYDVRLVITPCVPYGRLWRTCIVRFGNERHALRVRYSGADNITASARRLR